MQKVNNNQKVDKLLLFAIITILIVGIVTLSSASTVASFKNKGNNYFYLLKQLLYGVLPGLIFMYFVSRIDYHSWQKFAPLLILIGIVLLILVLVPSIGFKVSGARRWIDLKLFTFQPAEFLKLAVIFYLASWYDKRQQQAHDLYYGFLPSLAIVGLIAGLILMQPDMGTMLVLSAVAAVMIFIGGAKIKYLLSVGGIGLVMFWILIKADPERMSRITTFFDRHADPKGISYQVMQALIAIGSGGWWGLGLGQSRQKFDYLPESIGDSIFAIMAEEMGFVRVLIFLGLFVLLAYKGYRLAMKTEDNFGKLVATGITSWIIIQAMINIGGITSTIPLTGVPLPFVSYGSTAMVMNLCAMGVLLNISRQTNTG
jgi:cell division protein FtsW